MDKHEYLMLIEDTSQFIRRFSSLPTPIFTGLISGIARTHELCCAVKNMQLLLDENIEKYNWNSEQIASCRDCCMKAGFLLGRLNVSGEKLIGTNPQEDGIANGLCGIKEFFNTGFIDEKFMPEFDALEARFTQVDKDYRSMSILLRKICFSFCDTIKMFAEQYYVFQRMYNDYVIKDFWDYEETAAETIIDEIENELYTRNILENRADDPSARDWGKLLAIKLNELESEELREIEVNKRPIDINDERVLSLFENCKSYSDKELLFRNIVEINETKYRTKPMMRRLAKPQEDEEPALPLPAFVNEKIRNSNQCNWLLREAIDKLYPQTGKQGSSIKWSHVQIVMEHREFIDPSDGPTDFANKIRAIKTDIDDKQKDNIAKNVSNNSIDINLDEKYWDWPQRNIKLKRVCESVEDYFKPLMAAMQ